MHSYERLLVMIYVTTNKERHFIHRPQQSFILSHHVVLSYVLKQRVSE